MEWLNGNSDNGNMEVDIGFMPQMELSSTAESLPAVTGEEDLREKYIAPNASNQREIVWNEEISMEEAERLLEQEMYPFKKVSLESCSLILCYLKVSCDWRAVKKTGNFVLSLPNFR